MKKTWDTATRRSEISPKKRWHPSGQLKRSRCDSDQSRTEPGELGSSLPMKVLLPLGGAAAVAPNLYVSVAGIIATVAMFVIVYMAASKGVGKEAEPGE